MLIVRLLTRASVWNVTHLSKYRSRIGRSLYHKQAILGRCCIKYKQRVCWHYRWVMKEGSKFKWMWWSEVRMTLNKQETKRSHFWSPSSILSDEKALGGQLGIRSFRYYETEQFYCTLRMYAIHFENCGPI